MVPAGTRLQIRLRQTLSSYGTKQDTPVQVEVIAPVQVNGRTLLPMRTVLSGRVRDVRKVGLGFSRETAMLDLEFNRLQVPGQPEQPLSGKVVRVDDAREQVDDAGRIRGIRATATFSSTLSGLAVGAAAFDPMALLFALSSSLSIFRLPDSSIILPAGSELQFETTAPVTVAAEAPAQYPPLPGGAQDRGSLTELIRSLPFRTATEGDGAPSDLTSLLYLGSQDAVERAFLAAGWVRSDRLDGRSTYGVMRSIIENQGYRAAPMSVLLLNGKSPELTFAKTLNTFFSRHHLRIYGQSVTTADGTPVFTSTATYDSGVGFSKSAKTFIHLINENIDEERGKVVNDLLLTGCVDGVEYVDRPWVPLDAKNATGDSLRTDGRIAVLKLNECASPVRADVPQDPSQQVRTRQSAGLRPVRATMLTLRNDLIRGNLIYQVYSGSRLGLSLLRSTKQANGEPRSIRYGGQEFQIVQGATPPPKRSALPDDPGHTVHREQSKRAPASYLTRLMFSLSSGLTGYGNDGFSTLPTEIVARRTDGSEIRDRLDLNIRLERGWVLNPRLTLNAWRYVSSEFSYSRTSTNMQLFGQEQLLGQQVDLRSKALIRAFTYNALFHARPNGKRVRPYLAVGPSLQLIHLQDSKPEPQSLLRFAVRDLSLFLSAYDFGSKPPLEGGGIFQFGLNYGAGVHVHVTPRFFVRADYRETLSPQPDFWKSSVDKLAGPVTPNVRLDVQPLVKHGPLRQQLLTVGIGVAF